MEESTHEKSANKVTIMGVAVGAPGVSAIRTDVPDLCAEVQRLRQENARLRAAVLALRDASLASGAAAVAYITREGDPASPESIAAGRAYDAAATRVDEMRGALFALAEGSECPPE